MIFYASISNYIKDRKRHCTILWPKNLRSCGSLNEHNLRTGSISPNRKNNERTRNMLLRSTWKACGSSIERIIVSMDGSSRQNSTFILRFEKCRVRHRDRFSRERNRIRRPIKRDQTSSKFPPASLSEHLCALQL